MTHSSSELPLLYRQPSGTFLTNLRQPLSIAVLASLGMHGLMAMLLPLLPPSNPAAAEQGTVKLVELSPAEQLRLPQSGAPLTFPPLKNSPSSNTFATSPYILPPIGNTSPLSSDPSGTSASADRTITIPGNPTTYSTGYLSQEFLDQLDEQLRQALNEPSPEPTGKPTPTPKPTETPSQSANQPATSGTVSPTPTASPDPNRSPNPLQEARDRLREQETLAAKTTPAPTPPTAGTPTSEAEATGRLQAEIERIARADGVDTSRIYGAIDGAPKVLAVKCPIANCTEKVQALPTAPAVWVIVNPKGQVSILPVSTGDLALDEAIAAAAKAYVEQQLAADKYQVYQLRVQFDASADQA
jgi:hypothetical protein